MSDLLARTAKAIHTLFYATELAGERYRALEASLQGDAELAAFQTLSVGLVHFEPLPDDKLAVLAERFKEHEREYEEDRQRRQDTNAGRVVVTGHRGEEGQYFERLLTKMYERWDGTLDYEAGTHRLCFFSPFDEEGRRHTTFANVAVDGYRPDLHARTYVLGPYLLVKDDRTKRESDDPWGVLGGDLTLILPEEEAVA